MLEIGGDNIRRKAVPRLTTCCFYNLERYISDHCWEVMRLYSGTDFEQVVRREEMLWMHINELRECIFSQVPFNLQEEAVNMIIKAVGKVAQEKKNQYTMNTNIGMYKTELFCIVTMIDLIASDKIRHLDMPSIPKILRTHLTSRIKDFTGVRKLHLMLLGFGKDSRLCSVEEIVAPSNIIDALRGFKQLVHLILPKFCTNNIIVALSRTCQNTLRMLEIDHCEQLTDQAAVKMEKLQNLELLSLAGTTIGTPALAELVFRLKKLKHLLNADFLCDVCEYIQNDNDDIWLKGQPPPILKVQEFFNSEEYYFHTTVQMELVNKICPEIRKIRFFYDGEETCELSVLDNFKNLRELRINGGDLNRDPIRALFELIGHRLTRLEFNHVENIDRQFIAQLSLNCPNLKQLRFDTCSFVDYGTLYSELFDYYNEASLEEVQQIELAILLREQEKLSNEVENVIVPFEHLEELTMSSRCTRITMCFLLLNIPNVVRLYLGSGTTLDDDMMEQVLEKNKFTSLEVFSILGENDLTYWSLELLLENCPKLKEVKGLPFWTGVSDEERQLFETWIKDSNIDLDVEEIEPMDFSLFFNRNEMDQKMREEIVAYFSTA